MIFLDGNHLSIIEHTMNVLLLPDLHATDTMGDAVSVVSLPPTAKPTLSLPLPGLGRLPSPFHFQLHVITRLSFNEHGRITRHRDFVDTRDLFSLLPGAKFVQWAGTRVVARGLSAAAWILGRRRHNQTQDDDDSEAEREDLGPLPGPGTFSISTSPVARSKTVLGQHYEERSSGSSISMTGLKSLFVAPPQQQH